MCSSDLSLFIYVSLSVSLSLFLSLSFIPSVCQVTDHATTALLHYQLPQMPDVVVRSFMVRRREGMGRERRIWGGWGRR